MSFVVRYGRRNSCRVTLLIDFVAIKESTPTLASPYTFSGSMSINCNRIPRGGWPRIFLQSFTYRSQRKGAKIYLHTLPELSVNIKIFIFNKTTLVKHVWCEMRSVSSGNFERWFRSHGSLDLISVTQFYRTKINLPQIKILDFSFTLFFYSIKKS